MTGVGVGDDFFPFWGTGRQKVPLVAFYITRTTHFVARIRVFSYTNVSYADRKIQKLIFFLRAFAVRCDWNLRNKMNTSNGMSTHICTTNGGYSLRNSSYGGIFRQKQFHLFKRLIYMGKDEQIVDLPRFFFHPRSTYPSPTVSTSTSFCAPILVGT